MDYEYEATGLTQPTQVAHPWRAVVRTAFQALVGLCVIIPVIVDELGIGHLPWVAGAVAVSGAVTKIMTLPGVEQWIANYVPFLATGVHTEQ